MAATFRQCEMVGADQNHNIRALLYLVLAMVVAFRTAIAR